MVEGPCSVAKSDRVQILAVLIDEIPVPDARFDDEVPGLERVVERASGEEDRCSRGSLEEGVPEVRWPQPSWNDEAEIDRALYDGVRTTVQGPQSLSSPSMK